MRRARAGHSWFDVLVALALLAILLPALVGLQFSSSRSAGNDLLRFRVEHLALDALEAVKALDSRELAAALPPGQEIRDVHRIEPLATWLALHVDAGRGPWGTARISSRAVLDVESAVAGLHRLTLEFEWSLDSGRGGKVSFVRLVNLNS